MFTSQVRFFVLMVLSASLLLSVIGPWFHSPCTEEDPIPHELVEHHEWKTHSESSPLGHHHPCPQDREPISHEPEPCSSHITFCCSFDAISAVTFARVQYNAPFTLLDHWLHLRTLIPFHETDIRASMIPSLSFPQYKVLRSLPHSHVTLGIFLI